MESLKRSMKSCVKIYLQLASVESLNFATRWQTIAGYVYHVDAGYKNSKIRMKKVEIPGGIEIVDARDGLMITGR